MTPEEVLSEISRRAWSFGVAVVMSPERSVACDGVQVAGYFQGSGQPILAVATGRSEDEWLGVLLHEYSHLTQWAEDGPIWALSDSCDTLWDWLAGKKVRNPKQAAANVREVEADCERRTLRLARELNAPIDLERYARGANAYIHFHNTIAETRKWYADGRGPYLNEKVLALCNPTLDRDFSKTPKALADALRQCV
jgi:hypothetical protein